MKAVVDWKSDVVFQGKTGSGHSYLMDGPESAGGQGLGARPMEMLLLGLGGCTAYDVVTILKKARQSVEDCRVTLEAKRAETVPAVFTEVKIHYLVSGKNLNERQVARAVELSAKKYCSASIMFQLAGVKVEHSFEILQQDSI
jgi:putative redox protein